MERDSDEWIQWKREFDRENPHETCDCARSDPPETWCTYHAFAWSEEIEE